MLGRMPKLVRAPRRACAVAASGAAVAERGGEPLYRSSGDARASEPACSPSAASNFYGNDTISVTATDTVDNNQASASGVAVPQL